MKRALTLILTALLVLSSSVIAYGAEKTFTPSKSTYSVGEKISVSYSGTTEKDWIGIYPKGTTPSSANPSLDWEYADGGTGQVEFNIVLPEGEYDLILCENDGYNVLKRVSIKVEANTGIITDMQLSKTTYVEGEKIVINYTGSIGTGWIGIYNKGIEPKDEDGYRSLYWKWTKDFGQPNGTMEFNVNLLAGEYDAIMFEDEGYNIVKRITFTVVKPTYDTPADPESISYNRTAVKRGLADGTITIKARETTNLTGFAVFFANNEGPLKGYAPIVVKKGSGDTATYKFPQNVYIPNGATKFIAYTLNGDKLSKNFVSCDLPENSDLVPTGFRYSFQVISDLHLRANANELYNKHFDKALKDIKATDPNSKAVVVAGDITDNGLQTQYDQLKAILNANKDKLPPFYYTLGNHEFQNSGLTWEQEVELFKKNTDMPGLYFDFKINDSYFIVLGSEKEGLNAYLGTEQLKWLNNKLKEAEKNSKGPIFVINHQPLYNTVSGSLPGQGWNGVEQDKMLRSMLDSHPRVIVFTGHTHWELTSKSPMYDGGAEGATYFNTASVGYLWTDSQQHKDGSQGLFVEVYDDILLVRGRDFVSGKWISEAQFMVDLKAKAGEEEETTEPETTTPVETEEMVPETTAETEPEVTEPETEAETTAETEPATTTDENPKGDTKTGGIGKWIVPIAIGGAVVIGAAVGTVIYIKKKKK